VSANITKVKQEFDKEIIDIVDYVENYEIKSEVAYETAWNCLLDTLGCGLEALEYDECRNYLDR
jgi:2-methylcitrate dehydratase